MHCLRQAVAHWLGKDCGRHGLWQAVAHERCGGKKSEAARLQEALGCSALAMRWRAADKRLSF